MAGGLPDALDGDRPTVATSAWPGNLQPLDNCVPAELRNDLLPTILKQGTYNDKLYGVGTLESGLGLYARK